MVPLRDLRVVIVSTVIVYSLFVGKSGRKCRHYCLKNFNQYFEGYWLSQLTLFKLVVTLSEKNPSFL